jgi:MFS family permease
MLWSYPAGWLSDRIGRKRVLAAGYAVYGIVYLGFAAGGQAPAPGWMLWTLFAGYGVYAGLTDGIEKAFVADLAPPELRGTAIGLHATIAGAGLLPASLVAGLLWEHMGPASPFVLGGALGLIASAAVLLAVRGGTSAVSPAL